MYRGLQAGDVIAKARHLCDVLANREQRQAVSRLQHLFNKTRRRFFLEIDLFVRAQAGVNHEHQIQGKLRFRLEDFDLLFHTFLIKVERLS